MHQTIKQATQCQTIVYKNAIDNSTSENRQQSLKNNVKAIISPISHHIYYHLKCQKWCSYCHQMLNKKARKSEIKLG